MLGEVELEEVVGHALAREPHLAVRGVGGVPQKPQVVRAVGLVDEVQAPVALVAGERGGRFGLVDALPVLSAPEVGLGGVDPSPLPCTPTNTIALSFTESVPGWSPAAGQ